MSIVSFYNDEVEIVDYIAEKINLDDVTAYEEVVSFLARFEVTYTRCDRTCVVRDDGKVIATGSVEGSTFKYFFVDEPYKGRGVTRAMYDDLLSYVLKQGYVSYYAFTTPENIPIFEALGLSVVYQTKDACLLEGGFGSYAKWIARIRKKLPEKKGVRGSVVMNCNPMTKGHLYLVEEARKEVDELLVFVLQEDSSHFPFEDRYRIVKDELKAFDNVQVIMGGPYIISKATFPTYFIKKTDNMLDIYTAIDGGLFIDKIAKDLEIDVRFFGSEPKDIVTEQYTRMLRKMVSDSPIEMRVFPRYEVEEEPVSASVVRDLLVNDKKDDAYKLVVDNTIRFLESNEGEEVIWKMKKEVSN